MDAFYRSLIARRLSTQQSENSSASGMNNATDITNNLPRAHARGMSDMLATRSPFIQVSPQQTAKQTSPSLMVMPSSTDARNQLLPPNHHHRRRRSVSANNKPLLSTDQDTLNQPIPVDIFGQKVVGFNVGGEPRLCLPHLLSTVFKPVPLHSIYKACSDLHVYFSSATPSQLRVLFTLGALRESTQTCGLITRTQTERLCNVLNPPPPTPSSTCQFLSAYSAQIAAAEPYKPLSSLQHIIPVRHRCFGKCRGRAYADLYTSSDAACIQCEQCDMLLTPRAFVLHSHSKKSKRTSQQQQSKLNFLNSVAGRSTNSMLLATALAGDLHTTADAANGEQHLPEVVNTCHWGFDADKWRQYLHCFCRADEEPSRRALLEAAWEKFKRKFEMPTPMQMPPSPAAESNPPSTNLSLTPEQLQQLERMQRSGGAFASLPTASTTMLSNNNAAGEAPAGVVASGIAAHLHNLQPFAKQTNDATNLSLPSTAQAVAAQNAESADDGERHAALSSQLKLGITEIMTCLANQNRLTPDLYQSLLNVAARPDLIPSGLLSQLAAQLGITTCVDFTGNNVPVTTSAAEQVESVVTPAADASTALCAATNAQPSNLILTPSESDVSQQQQQHVGYAHHHQSASAESPSSANDELVRKLSVRLTDSLTQLEKLKPKLPAPVREVFSSAVDELNATYKDAFDQQAKHVDDLEMQLAALKLQSSNTITTDTTLLPSTDQIALLSRALAQRDEIIKALNDQLCTHGAKTDAVLTIAPETTGGVAGASASSPTTTLVAHLNEMIAARDEKIVQLERQVELLENKLTSVLMLNKNTPNDAVVKPVTDAGLTSHRVHADDECVPSKSIKYAEKKADDEKLADAAEKENLCLSKPAEKQHISSSAPGSFTSQPSKTMSPPPPILFMPCASAMSRQKRGKLRSSFSTESLRNLYSTSTIADDSATTIPNSNRQSNDENDNMHNTAPHRRGSFTAVVSNGRIVARNEQNYCGDIVDLRENHQLADKKLQSGDEQLGRRGSLQILTQQHYKDPRTPPKRTLEECEDDDGEAKPGEN